jgi:signal transduction histidine kinase/CheY-like chemotaxis protein
VAEAASKAQPLSPALQAQLVRERLQLAIQQTQRVRLPHTLVDLALAWVAWEAGLRHGVWIYLLVMTLSHLGRSTLLARMLASGHYSTAQLMQASMVALAYLGLIKGLLTLAVFSQPSSDWHELFTMILIGNAAGAVATAGGHLRTYLAWAIPFGGGLVGGWLLHGGVEGVLIALLVVALFWVLSGYVREQGDAQEKLLGLNDSLRAARDRAERANEARTRFFAAASHDLRQPLTALSYSVATVEALAQLQADDKLAIVGGSLRRSLTESQTLLNSLLEVSQLDAGAVEVQQQALDLGALVAGVVDALQPQAEDRGLRLQASGLERRWPVRTDEALLRRVLQNLLGNALKFTPPGGLVRVLLQADGDGVAVALIDNGPGIAPELQERVFEEFFQVGNAARNRSQGLGLGLSIVRRLVALLGLRLSLDSEPGRGSCFTLHLPLHAVATLPQAHERPPEPSLPAAGQALRLLVVDDEAPIREALSLLLSSLGWEVRGADGQLEALQQLQGGWQPDALLLDFRLRDGESGLDVLRSLRQQGCQAPAWLVTGETAPQRIQQAREAGLPVLYKPVDGLALAALVRTAIESKTAATPIPGGQAFP